jgi:hypothetical protein
MKQCQFFVIVDGVTKKKDGTLTLKLGTNELGPEETSKIFEMGNQQVWCALSETSLEASDLDIPDFVPEFEGEKSHSRRLREILYVVWQKYNDGKKSSDQHYRDTMEKLIQNYKDKLD